LNIVNSVLCQHLQQQNYADCHLLVMFHVNTLYCTSRSVLSENDIFQQFFYFVYIHAYPEFQTLNGLVNFMDFNLWLD